VRKGPGASVSVIAHRGASGHAPEHTWAAYELAMEMGVDFLEPDLQMTRDGHLVAFHDATLERTARGPGECCSGPVASRTLGELRRCDVGAWFNEAHPERARPGFRGQRIVTLDELLDRWGRQVRWLPEMKDPREAPGMEKALLELLDRNDLRAAAVERGHVLIQSFSVEALRLIEAMDPHLPLVQLMAPEPAGDQVGALQGISRYAVGVGPHHSLVSGPFMEEARRLELQVHTWTVNEPEAMERLVDLGVDGIFTDFPDRLLRVLRTRGLRDLR
jgi:glycerophosphoryl diester phosphodiesterase